MDMKQLAVLAVTYREELHELLGSLDAADLKQGRIVLQAGILNGPLKPHALAWGKPFLKDYGVDFVGGALQLDLSLEVSQLGPVRLKCRLIPVELRFGPSGHTLYARYEEEAASSGNLAQKLAVRAALAAGPLVKTALRFANAPGISLDGGYLLVELDKMPLGEKIPPDLALEFVEAEHSRLTLQLI